MQSVLTFLVSFLFIFKLEGESRKVMKQLSKMVKAKRIRTDGKGQPILKDGKPIVDEYDRLEYAREVATRIGVTRRTVRKAHQGLAPALQRVREASQHEV